MTEIILGIGSNLGDQQNNIKLAVDMVREELLTDIIQSPIYKSAPLLLENSPTDWNREFMNVVIAGKLKDEQISPLKFLEKIKKFETILGRKVSPRWSPREIDIDILAWGNEIINTPDLKIPHPEMLNRDFVMVPLLEILPGWKYP